MKYFGTASPVPDTNELVLDYFLFFLRWGMQRLNQQQTLQVWVNCCNLSDICGDGSSLYALDKF
jgi:hypothetical protein